ncbi:hypothetical protein AVEN_117351-1 [Araneus ventricosus]|uniref:Uncharacterized protein n=1 Tax=Araneus ventricosus TaxID=182803 RepID=A0A4Y2HZI4_ARAVE|nr:hypothetical protein AVEN_117351-1 [Araneus ventricosus]
MKFEFQICKPGSEVSVGARGFQVRNPIPLKIRRVRGLFQAKSYVMAKHPPAGVVLKFGEEVPAQVSSSSSDRRTVGHVFPGQVAISEDSEEEDAISEEDDIIEEEKSQE